MPKVSILVPIYNAAEFLRQALESLTNQTLSELEIICINDGSTDNSLAIVQEFAQRDSRIVILDKPNSGYGDSMNQGIKLARGEYIGILEPDDYLDSEAFAKLYQLATWHHADIVKANYYLHESGQDRKLKVIRPQYTGKIIVPRQDRFVFRLHPAIWSGIYRREFLLQNRIEFLPTPGASYQDIGFNIKALALAERVIFTTDAFLHYRVDNVNSSSNSSGKLDCTPREYASVEEFLQQRDLVELMPAITSAKIGSYLWNINRLQAPEARKFYQTMLAELQVAKNRGWLKRSEFVPRYWLIVQSMLKFPKLTEHLLIH